MKFDLSGSYKPGALLGIIFIPIIAIAANVFSIYLCSTEPGCGTGGRIGCIVIILFIDIYSFFYECILIYNRKSNMLYIIEESKLKIDFWGEKHDLDANNIHSITLYTYTEGGNGQAREYRINIILNDGKKIEFEFLNIERLKFALKAFCDRNNIKFEDKIHFLFCKTKYK